MFVGTSAGDEFAGEVSNASIAATQGGIYSIEVVPDRTSQVPRYRITTKVRVVNPVVPESDIVSMGAEDAFGGAVVANLFETYPVSRTLEQLKWFRDQYWGKEPYTIVAPLPEPSRASSLKAVDQVLALLFLMSSTPRTSSDPLFWALLTAADDDFAAQVQRRSKTEKISKAFWSAVSHYTASTPKPKLELKPSAISPAMIESSMIDRAFLTLDKINTCVDSLHCFQTRLGKSKPLLEAWDAAHGRLYLLRVSLDSLSGASRAVAPALRELCDTNYWPWTKDRVFEDALSDQGSGDALHTSHRLTHYMHRAANTVVQVGLAENGVVSDDWAMAISLCATLWGAYQHSAIHCDAHLGEEELKSKTGGSTLMVLQKAALGVIESGRGMSEADRLERIDAEVTEIQDVVDAHCADFDGHFDEVRTEIAKRALRHLRELKVAQSLAWQSTQLLIDDLKGCLSDDPFLDLLEEELPMFPREAVAGSPPSVVVQSTSTTTTINPPREPSSDGGAPSTTPRATRFDAKDSNLIARLFAAAAPLLSARSDKDQESARAFGRRLRQQFEEDDPSRNPFDIAQQGEAEEMSSLGSPTSTSAMMAGSLNPDELIEQQEAAASDAMIGGAEARRQSIPKQRRRVKSKQQSWTEVYDKPDAGNEFGW